MLFHVLTVIFVVAKILELITWSWWLVFAPSIIAIVLGLLIVFTGGYYLSKFK